MLFTSATVPEALKCELMHRKGKPYYLFSYIILPSFAHIISITHAGPLAPLCNWNFLYKSILVPGASFSWLVHEKFAFIPLS